MYWAITFSLETRAKLMRILDQFMGLEKFEDWTEYADHITLIHSSHEHFETANNLLTNFEGVKVEFKIVGLGISNAAVAFEVNLLTANKHAHITMYVKPGHKPVESNEIEHWNLAYCAESFIGKLSLMP